MYKILILTLALIIFTLGCKRRPANSAVKYEKTFGKIEYLADEKAPPSVCRLVIGHKAGQFFTPSEMCTAIVLNSQHVVTASQCAMVKDWGNKNFYMEVQCPSKESLALFKWKYDASHKSPLQIMGEGKAVMAIVEVVKPFTQKSAIINQTLTVPDLESLIAQKSCEIWSAGFKQSPDQTYQMEVHGTLAEVAYTNPEKNQIFLKSPGVTGTEDSGAGLFCAVGKEKVMSLVGVINGTDNYMHLILHPFSEYPQLGTALKATSKK